MLVYHVKVVKRAKTTWTLSTAKTSSDRELLAVTTVEVLTGDSTRAREKTNAVSTTEVLKTFFSKAFLTEPPTEPLPEPLTNPKTFLSHPYSSHLERNGQLSVGPSALSAGVSRLFVAALH